MPHLRHEELGQSCCLVDGDISYQGWIGMKELGDHHECNLKVADWGWFQGTHQIAPVRYLPPDNANLATCYFDSSAKDCGALVYFPGYKDYFYANTCTQKLQYYLCEFH